jgi:hypothetical protein
VRVLSVTVANAALLVAHPVHFALNRALWQTGEYWEHPCCIAASDAIGRGERFLAVGVPMVLALAILYFRRRSLRDGTTRAPSGWGFVLLGALAAFVAQALSFIVLNASVRGGATVGLGETSLQVLGWGSTLLLPSVLFGSAHACLHKAAPTPERVLDLVAFSSSRHRRRGSVCAVHAVRRHRL